MTCCTELNILNISSLTSCSIHSLQVLSNGFFNIHKSLFLLQQTYTFSTVLVLKHCLPIDYHLKHFMWQSAGCSCARADNILKTGKKVQSDRVMVLTLFNKP